MVFSTLHWLPSAIAAILTIVLVLVRNKKYHRYIGILMAFFAVLGLAGYLQSGGYQLAALDSHAVHAIVGSAALILSLFVFAVMAARRKGSRLHCWLGYLAALLAAASLVMGAMLLTGLESQPEYLNTTQHATPNILPEIEATEFDGVALTPVSLQNNNAIKGTQYIDRDAYRLHVYGLVDTELDMTYDELLSLPAYSEAAEGP